MGKGEPRWMDVLEGDFWIAPCPFDSLLETRTFQHQGQLPALQAHWEHSAAGSHELSGSFG